MQKKAFRIFMLGLGLTLANCAWAIPFTSCYEANNVFQIVNRTNFPIVVSGISGDVSSFSPSYTINPGQTQPIGRPTSACKATTKNGCVINVASILPQNGTASGACSLKTTVYFTNLPKVVGARPNHTVCASIQRPTMQVVNNQYPMCGATSTVYAPPYGSGVSLILQVYPGR